MTNITDWPFFGKDEREAVSRVLRSGRVNYWTGKNSSAFEVEFAEYSGSRRAIALSTAPTNKDAVMLTLLPCLLILAISWSKEYLFFVDLKSFKSVFLKKCFTSLSASSLEV